MTTRASTDDDATLEVLDGGLLTTVQDAGRPGLGRLGVASGGAADPWSLAVANALLGNDPDAAALEATLAGPVLRVLHATTLGVAGADLGGTVLETGRPLTPGEAVPLRAGWTVSFAGPATGGARAYLSLPGGVAVPPILGSRSTALGAGFGGHEGRALRAGDRIRAAAPATDRLRPAARWPGPSQAHRPPAIRVLPGPHADGGGAAMLEALLAGAWSVSGASDRMGLRLDGPGLPGSATGELASHGVTWGTIQVPPDRRPIVLLVDHQPTGGYPVIAVVITADRPTLGQLRPGDGIRFETVSIGEARQALADRRAVFAAALGHLRDDLRWDELWQTAGG